MWLSTATYVHLPEKRFLLTVQYLCCDKKLLLVNHVTPPRGTPLSADGRHQHLNEQPHSLTNTRPSVTMRRAAKSWRVPVFVKYAYLSARTATGRASFRVVQIISGRQLLVHSTSIERFIAGET